MGQALKLFDSDGSGSLDMIEYVEMALFAPQFSTLPVPYGVKLAVCALALSEAKPKRHNACREAQSALEAALDCPPASDQHDHTGDVSEVRLLIDECSNTILWDCRWSGAGGVLLMPRKS